MTGHGPLTATIAGAYVFGMTGAIMASIRSPFGKHPDDDPHPANAATSAFHLTMIPMMLVGGIITDMAAPRWGLIGGPLLVAAGLFLLSFSRNGPGSLIAIVAVAAGTALLGTATVALIPSAFFDGSPAASLNLGFVFVAFGALLTPLAMQTLIHIAGLPRALGISAFFSLVPALIGIVTPPVRFSTHSANNPDLAQLFSGSGIWIAAAVFAVYIVLEGSIATWLSQTQADTDPRERRTGTLLAWFWVAAIGSRIAMGFAQQNWFYESSEPWVIAILAVLTAAAVGNMIGSDGRIRAVWGVVAVGILTGPILPTLISIVLSQFGEAGGSTAFGAMFAIGATGSLMLAPLANVYSSRHTARQALRAPLAAALILAAVTLVLGLAI